MFAMYANGWSSALENPVDERERIQRLVLAEARAASDWHASNGGVHEAEGLLDRVRRAIGIAPAPAPSCVACAA
jgi:hypothetical protein